MINFKNQSSQHLTLIGLSIGLEPFKGLKIDFSDRFKIGLRLEA